MVRVGKHIVPLALVVLLLAPTLSLAGCGPAGELPQVDTGDESREPGAQNPMVTAWCDPWPPVQLSEDTAQGVLALLEQPRPQTLLPNLQGVLVFHLRAGDGAEAVEATLYRSGVIVDGRVRSDAAADELWQAVRSEVCSGAVLARLVSTVDEVCVVCRDVGMEVPLDAGGRRRVAEQAAALGPYSEADEPPCPMPYPDYGLEIRAATGGVALLLHHDRVVAAWHTDDGYRSDVSLGHKDQALWRLLGELATAPDPATLQGPARLFVYQNVRAEGGPLAEPMEAPPGWTVVMVRCLLSGKPVAGGAGAPAGKEPVPAIFSDPTGKFPPCTVLLYEEGFLLDGCFYRSDLMQRSFLTTLNNAGSA